MTMVTVTTPAGLHSDKKNKTNNSTMFTGKLLLPMATLFAGFVVAFLAFQHRSNIQYSAEVVKQPIIGGTGANREGPWPECIGKTGEDCVQLIEAYAEDVRGRVYIVPPDSMVTMDFRTDRVRVWVNENNLVEKAPSRG